MDLNKFIPTENQLHPVHLVCAEGLYVNLGTYTVPRYLGPFPSQPPIADLLNFGKIQTLFLNLSQYKIFHYFMHMRAKTICEFTAERSVPEFRVFLRTGKI
eukprot:COSAG05_NODE_532_length_8897_cov_18.622301_7_plen_101_part_00